MIKLQESVVTTREFAADELLLQRVKSELRRRIMRSHKIKPELIADTHMSVLAPVTYRSFIENVDPSFRIVVVTVMIR